MTSSTEPHRDTGADLLDARTSGYVAAYAWTAIVNALLVLLKENVEPVMGLMKSLGHHWTTQAVLLLVIFFALGMYFSGQGKQMTGTRAVNYLIWSTVFGGGIIAAFNLYHTL